MAMLRQPWMSGIARVVSSDEVKAIETAQIVSDHLGLEPEIRRGVGEMDRSSTGFLPPAEFEQVADAFFAEPDRSIRGWERATDARRRIADALGDLLASADDVAVIGHGGVGTLWYCHLADRPVSRRWDQPGQGHYFTVDTATATPLHHWIAIDQIDHTDRTGEG